jgi:hypothetical protein
MRISVFLKPNAKKQEILQYNGIFRVSVKSAPKENEANRELTEVLSVHFKTPRSSINIVSGFNSRNKVVEITLGSK